jgi:uncharacterized membrane protein YeiH
VWEEGELEKGMLHSLLELGHLEAALYQVLLHLAHVGLLAFSITGNLGVLAAQLQHACYITVLYRGVLGLVVSGVLRRVLQGIVCQ